MTDIARRRPDPPQTVVEFEGFPGLYLDNGHWRGVPFAATTLIPDGQIVAVGTPTQQFMIGVGLWSELEEARYRARWIVQNGLRDVLEWLGERVIPEHHVTGAEVMNAIRAGVV